MLLEKIPVRLRLSIVHAAWISVLFLIIGVGLFKVVEHTLMQSVDAALLSSARSIRDVSNIGTQVQQDVFVEGVVKDSMSLEQLVPERFVRPYAQVINLEAKEVQGKYRKLDVKLPITPKTLHKAEKGEHSFETFRFKNRPSFRQISLPLMKSGQFSGNLVQVGTSLGPTQSLLKGTKVLLWLLLPLVLLISVILGYVLTAQALKPVGQMSHAASKLGAHDLSIRLNLPPAQDELRELALTFNKLFDRLEDAITRLRRFTADVSHELRTPLAVLRAEAELSLRKERSAEDYKTALKTIFKESKHMSDIIEELLLFAKAESKNISLSWELVSTKNFVEELVEFVKPIYKQRSVSLKHSVEAPDLFSCSKTYLFLALKNILFNASKHSSPGSVVSFEVSLERNHMKFRVHDEGEGIPKKDLPYIFDPFYRSDTARNRASGGVGIGLSLTLALIRLHKGDIQVQSTVGEGTVFIVTIPYKLG